MNLEEIKFHPVAVPFGDSISAAYVTDREFDAIRKEGGATEISKKFRHPKLYETFRLKNNWIAYKQYLDDGFLMLKSEEEFWRFKDGKMFLSSGISWNEPKNEIGYCNFWLKPAAIEALKQNHQWREIPIEHEQERLYISAQGVKIIRDHTESERDKLFISEDGAVMELAWPHFRSGWWYPSLKDYETCLDWTSGE